MRPRYHGREGGDKGVLKAARALGELFEAKFRFAGCAVFVCGSACLTRVSHVCVWPRDGVVWICSDAFPEWVSPARELRGEKRLRSDGPVRTSNVQRRRVEGRGGAC